MFKAQAAFAGISVSDLAAAKEFYTKTLGLKLADDKMGLNFELPSGGGLFVYDKPDHQPATYTALNFVVTNIDKAVDALATAGVKFERYDNMPTKPDEKGILRGLAAGQGPDIAWFKDPAGNILSVLQDK
ncbi:MAG TPA: VOC family protein [Candidatus Saccharimonadales bacterium]|nr:VOC family protein [Candidatus Saccharimonadales bacterium]